MREYLERGGFWMLDDFWGSFEWGNMAAEMKKVLPDAEIQRYPARTIRSFISSSMSIG